MIVHHLRRFFFLVPLVLLTCVLGACREESPEPHVESVPDADHGEPAPNPAVVFVCAGADGDKFAFTTRLRTDSLDLWLPDRFERRFLALPMVDSDSTSSTFRLADVSVRTAGAEADLSATNEHFTRCSEDVPRSIWANARLRGVTIRAVGNEPGWYLEVTDGGQMKFVFDYGEREALVPTPEPDIDPASRVAVYHAVSANYDLLVEVEELACTDSMSGQGFSHTVTVEFEGRAFFGCGGRMTTFIGQV